MLKYLQSRSVRILLPAVCGMLIYGNWAAFVNQHTDHQWLSGLVEGSRAFLFTIIGNTLTELVWAKTASIRSLRVRIPTAAGLTWFLMQSIALSIHFSINPVTALQTVAPSLIISSIYVSLYVAGLAKINHHFPAPCDPVDA